ncbi:NDxxF motif lipoprotein [Staphylococcus auricularis]|uniref:NDxxF motif lipoprotein n=1 Tax=Staphylococcus auricularis TaxID=29379 RepID=UPI001EF2D7FE|nr:NDxxF motif lipoprotein [Staphylococcus auricularis]MCG7340786.1 NDxxF motif lipoprotein [Staphylococcus auricularis]
MKFRMIAVPVLALGVLAAGCNDEDEVEGDEDTQAEQSQQSTSSQTAKLPDKVFHSNKENENLTESDMKQSIKTYLDTDEKINRVINPYLDKLDEEEDLDKKEEKAFKKAEDLLDENDENFENYVENNQIPEGYQKYAPKISEYMQAVNSEKDEDVTDMIEDAVDGDFPTKKEVKEAKDYTSKANGREQEKIENFLDEKGIETINFQK